MARLTIQSTKNYRLFERSDDNRPLDEKQHRKLKQSMQLYGWLPEFPMVCHKNGTGKWKIDDGQHRFAFAESMGLTVHWIPRSQDFDIAVVNSTSKTWKLRDYAQKFSANGNKEYRAGIEFADEHHLPIGSAFALLTGYTSFSNVQDHFVSGNFKIKDKDWAEAVATVYTSLCLLSKQVKTARFLEACMGVCRVDGFESKRLISNAERCREKLVSYSTKDAYLAMLEEIYNFGRVKLVGLKAEALMAMKKRNVSQKHTIKGG